MGYENILQHIKAVVHLWRIQRSIGFNKEENPRNGALLTGFLKKIKRGRARQRKDLFLDKGVDSLIDGYQSRDLPLIYGYFFNQNTADGLRNRLDFFLGHAILGRSEDKRNAMLSDLYLYEVEEEGPSECQASVLNLFKGKTNQEGKTQVGVSIRHKDVRICPVGALAFYLFGRFHVSHEPFPNMASRQQWYNVCLFRGKGTAPITYRRQHRAIEACYQALKILSSKKTHSMRGAGTVLY
jgi:Centromere DNA-binding protein complex CBF3 subunit, domain 2